MVRKRRSSGSRVRIRNRAGRIGYVLRRRRTQVLELRGIRSISHKLRPRHRCWPLLPCAILTDYLIGLGVVPVGLSCRVILKWAIQEAAWLRCHSWPAAGGRCGQKKDITRNAEGTKGAAQEAHRCVNDILVESLMKISSQTQEEKASLTGMPKGRCQKPTEARRMCTSRCTSELTTCD